MFRRFLRSIVVFCVVDGKELESQLKYEISR